MKKYLNLMRLLTVSLLLVAGSAGARELNPPLGEAQGVIQGLDFGTYRAVINGYDYEVSQSVRVEINGSYGAFTMLTEGMKVEFSYLQFKDGTREVTEMRQVNEIDEY
jgi:hypothetical protein